MGDMADDAMNHVYEGWAEEALTSVTTLSLLQASREMFEMWYEEYRSLGYGNCAHCGAAATGHMVKSTDEVACEHEPDCHVPAWRAAIAAAEAEQEPNRGLFQCGECGRIDEVIGAAGMVILCREHVPPAQHYDPNLGTVVEEEAR